MCFLGSKRFAKMQNYPGEYAGQSKFVGKDWWNDVEIIRLFIHFEFHLLIVFTFVNFIYLIHLIVQRLIKTTFPHFYMIPFFLYVLHVRMYCLFLHV